MPLVKMKDILIPARAGKYAVGAFEFWSYDSAQAVVEAAADADMPVILQAGEIECNYAGGIAILADIARRVAENASVSVALHLDHADTIELISNAIGAGFTSVMIDASLLPFDENTELTKRVVEMARPHGVTVEAELGRLGGSEGNISVADELASQTDPSAARDFVEITGIDALAVAIGTAHGLYKFPPNLNLERLADIAGLVDIPLVLHGGSGTPECDIIKSIPLGIAKINICTEFILAYAMQAEKCNKNSAFKYSVPAFFGSMKEAGYNLVKQKIGLFANGRQR